MRCRPHSIFALFLLVGFLFAPGMLSAETLYVTGDGKTGFATIQSAVDAAADGDVIIINPGTYTGRGNRDVVLRNKSLSLQCTDPDDPSVVESTILDCAGRTTDPHRGFEVSNSIVEISGLTVVNGVAEAGGAVLCDNSILTLANCHIRDNATLAGGPGGGLYGENAMVTLVGCLIVENTTGAGVEGKTSASGFGGDGGGVCSENSVVYVYDSSIVGNATGAGGDSGILAGNGGNGGGICADALVVFNSDISNNTCGAGGSGGGVYCSRANIAASVIEGNAAGSPSGDPGSSKGDVGQGGAGGGIYCGDSIEINNCLIVGNRSTDGSGIWCPRGIVNLCTVAGNSGADGTDSGAKDPQAFGAGVICSDQMALTNSILWHNVPDQIQGHDCGNIIYCNIEGAACPTSRDNISLDPQFVQPGYWDQTTWVAGDYHLTAGSPCINAGDPDYTARRDETDLDGRTRVGAAAVDMGAYESTDLVPVYRFWSPRTGRHFYTAKEAEKDKLVADFPEAWVYEGPVYYVYGRNTEPDLVPVYRLWSEVIGSHFWTISEAEKTSLLDNHANEKWIDEGVVFYAYSGRARGAGTSPVYRFWSDAFVSHFYTIRESEKESLIERYSDVWTYEGPVWYAFTGPDAGGDDDDDDPAGTDDSSVYEFTGGSDAATFTLELTAKIDGKPAQLDASSLALRPAGGSMQMGVDFDRMTAQLNALHVETGNLEHTGVAGDAGSGQGQFTFTVFISGAFDSAAAKGPYGIDAKTLSFPTTSETGSVGEGETYTITGSAIIDGEKSDIDLTLVPTDFQSDGLATFLESANADVLDLSMDGPFKWSRRQGEDLLFTKTFKGGRVLEVFVAAVEFRTTGLWIGKQTPTEPGGEKPEK